MGFATSLRVGRYQKDASQEHLLRSCNKLLAPLETEITRDFVRPQLPILFLIGAPRSGSTLLSQLLAETGLFGYVSNFVARFWQAPHIGARIEQALGIRNEPSVTPYEAVFGTTTGWSSPHEFGYFWNRWFPFGQTHKLTAEEGKLVDIAGLQREAAAIQAVYGKPFFFKSLLCSFQIALLAEAFENAVFVVCRRAPIYQAQSLLLARQQVLGSTDHWFSLRPKEYPELQQLSCYEQVAAQIFYSLRDIDGQLAVLPPQQRLDIIYESCCADPRQQVSKILAAAGIDPTVDNWQERLPASFESTNRQRLDQPDWAQLKAACKRYSQKPD